MTMQDKLQAVYHSGVGFGMRCNLHGHRHVNIWYATGNVEHTCSARDAEEAIDWLYNNVIGIDEEASDEHF